MTMATPALDVESYVHAWKRACILAIVREATDRAGVTFADLLGHARTPPRLVHARHDVWRAVYETRDAKGRRMYSLTEIARLFNRDHTTIMVGVRKAAE